MEVIKVILKTPKEGDYSKAVDLAWDEFWDKVKITRCRNLSHIQMIEDDSPYNRCKYPVIQISAFYDLKGER